MRVAAWWRKFHFKLCYHSMQVLEKQQCLHVAKQVLLVKRIVGHEGMHRPSVDWRLRLESMVSGLSRKLGWNPFTSRGSREHSGGSHEQYVTFVEDWRWKDVIAHMGAACWGEYLHHFTGAIVLWSCPRRKVGGAYSIMPVTRLT